MNESTKSDFDPIPLNGFPGRTAPDLSALGLLTPPPKPAMPVEPKPAPAKVEPQRIEPAEAPLETKPPVPGKMAWLPEAMKALVKPTKGKGIFAAGLVSLGLGAAVANWLWPVPPKPEVKALTDPAPLPLAAVPEEKKPVEAVTLEPPAPMPELPALPKPALELPALPAPGAVEAPQPLKPTIVVTGGVEPPPLPEMPKASPSALPSLPPPSSPSLPMPEMPKSTAVEVPKLPSMDLPKSPPAMPETPKLPSVDLPKPALDLPKAEPPKPAVPELPKVETPKMPPVAIPVSETPEPAAPELPKVEAPKMPPPVVIDAKPPVEFTAPKPASPPPSIEMPSTPKLDEPKPLKPTQVAPRQDYDVDVHYVAANESWNTISKKHLGDERYAEALRAYNGQRVLQPGGAIDVPPIYILRKQYGNMIANVQPVEFTAPKVAGAAKNYDIPAGGLTFRELAKRALGDEAMWGPIWELNPKLRADEPIPAGTRVRLPADSKLGE